MLLTDSVIRRKCQEIGMISPFNESQLQPCSYDVTLSPSIIRYSGNGIIDASSSKFEHSLEYFKFNMNDDGYVLSPGDFILGSTNEFINLPDYVM